LRKRNYLAIIAGILALVTLALPWFNGAFKGETNDMQFTASLYQISGTVNGTSESTVALVRFGLVAVAFLVIAAVASFAGSIVMGKKGQMLILTGGILSLLSIVVFGAGMLNSDFADMDLNPSYTLSYFPDHFGLTTQQIDADWYHYSWSLNIGFYMALVTAIIGFASLVVHNQKKPVLAEPVKVAVN
jgi:hypothetical protein